MTQDQLPAKEPTADRKRRLARERQRRHRQKIRRVQDPEVVVPASAPVQHLTPVKAVSPLPKQTSQAPQNAHISSIQRPTATVPTRASARVAQQQPHTPTRPAAVPQSLRRSDRKLSATVPQSRPNASAAQQRPTRVRRNVGQDNVHVRQAMRQSQQQLHVPRTTAATLAQLNAAHKENTVANAAALQQQQTQIHLQQQQQQAHMRHHPDVQQPQSDVTVRQQRLQAQHGEHHRQKNAHYGHALLVQHQQPAFGQNHGFSASTQLQGPSSQAVHQHNVHNFPFSSQIANSNATQSQFVTEAQRQYLQQHGLSGLSLQNDSYLRVGTQARQPHARQRSDLLEEAADAAAGLTALPDAVNGMHPGMPHPPHLASAATMPMSGERAPPYANTANAVSAKTTSLQQKQAQNNSGAAPIVQVDTYAHDPNETAEGRKRRLARDRQRRRRRRIKGDTEDKAEANELQRPGEPGEGHLAGPVSLAASTMPLPVQGIQSHGQAVVDNAVTTQFEPGALLEAQRLHANDDGVRNVPTQPETPELRKRRLARNRQRKRRNRLKRTKLGSDGIEKSPSTSQALKSSGDGTVTPLGESAGHRSASELERRALVTDGGGESERVPGGSPGSAVFGGRADLSQSLAFSDQVRGMRGNPSMADGMGINFVSGSNGLNLQMQVENMEGGVQSQGLTHWSQGFDSEASARLAVENAVAAFRTQLPNISQNGRTYVVQQGIMMLTGSEEAGRIF